MTSDRFVLCKAGELPSPGKCWCCGAYDRDCVHWGYDEDFVGVILLCVNCVREAVTLFEGVSEQQQKIAELEKMIDRLTSFLEELGGTLVDCSGRVTDTIVSTSRHLDLAIDAGAIAHGALKG